MGAPLRRSARLLNSESSVPVARDLDVEMVNGEDEPVEQQRSDTRSSVSHSSVSQDPTTAPSPKPELGESTDDDDEEPVNHHVRSNRSDRRQVPRSTNPATQPIKPAERDATSPQRSSVPQLVPEPSRKRKTSDRPLDTDSDTDYEDYQDLSPPGQDESESDFGLESPQHTRKSTRPRRGKKIHDTLQDDSDGLIHPRPVLKRPRRKRRNNANMTTDHGDETLHAHPHDHAHRHTSDHGHDHDHSSEHTHNYGTHQDGFSPASGHGRHRHHQHGHHNSPRVHNHHAQRPYRKEHQLGDSVSVPGLRTMLLENRWENSKIDPSVMIARRPAICIKFGLNPAEKTEDSSQTERDTVQDELDYDGSLILSSHDQKRVKEILDILLVYLRQNNDDDGDYDDGNYDDDDYDDDDYDDDDYDDDSLEDRVLSQLKEEEVDMFLQYLEEAGLSVEDALEDSFVGLDGRETGDQKQPDTATRLPTANVQPQAFKHDVADTSQAPHGSRSAVHAENGEMVGSKARASGVKKPIFRTERVHAPRNFVTNSEMYRPKTPEEIKALCKTRGIDTTIVKVGAKGVTKKQASKTQMIELLKAWDYADAGVEPAKCGRKKVNCDCAPKKKYCIHDASGEINPIKLEYQPKFPCNSCPNAFLTEDDFVRPAGRMHRLKRNLKKCNYCAIGDAKFQWTKPLEKAVMDFLRQRITKARAAEGDMRPVTDADITSPPEGFGSRPPWASTWLCDSCGRRMSPDTWKSHHATPELCAAWILQEETKEAQRRVSREEKRNRMTDEEFESRQTVRCTRCKISTRASLFEKHHATPETCANWRIMWEKIHAITAQKSIPAVPKIDKRMCDRCKEWHIFSNGDHRVHLEECRKSGLIICGSCRASIPQLGFLEHRKTCSQQLALKKRALQLKGNCGWLYSLRSAPCETDPLRDLGFCAVHANVRTTEKKNTIAEKSELRGKLFNKFVRRKALRRLKKLDCFSGILEFIELWEKHPEEVMVIDTELNISSCLTPHHVYQISIKNANNEFVVPPTIINHGMSKGELYRLLEIRPDSFIKDNTFRRFLGEPDESPAHGADLSKTASWATVADMVAKYLKAKGIGRFRACIDWSDGFLDYKALKAGLESLSRVELLPPDPYSRLSSTFNPLYWWRILKGVAGLDTELILRLNLGNLFEILFQDQTDLLSRAHTADADVEMLIQIVTFFVDFCNGRDYQGEIERYYKPEKPEDADLDSEVHDRAIEAEAARILRSGQETERTEDDSDDITEPNDASSVDDDHSMDGKENVLNTLGLKSDEELRHLLEDRGLDGDGAKTILIERLLNDEGFIQEQLVKSSATLNPETFDPALHYAVNQ